MWFWKERKKMGEKWSPRRLINNQKNRERESEREKQHHPLTHQKGIRFFLTPPKSKFVPLITTIHPPSVNMRWETRRKKEKVRERERDGEERERVCLYFVFVCVFFFFSYLLQKYINTKAVLSYTYPTSPYFLPFFILDFFSWVVIVRGC